MGMLTQAYTGKYVVYTVFSQLIELRYHCVCHGNIDTIATEYVADGYYPKEALCQI